MSRGKRPDPLYGHGYIIYKSHTCIVIAKIQLKLYVIWFPDAESVCSAMGNRRRGGGV